MCVLFLIKSLYFYRSEEVVDTIDLDIAQETQPLKKRGVKIAGNLMLLSNLLFARPDGSQPYEWAALTIVRGKPDDKKRFRFNMPFGCVPQLIEGLQYLLRQNESFFGPGKVKSSLMGEQVAK